MNFITVTVLTLTFPGTESHGSLRSETLFQHGTFAVFYVIGLTDLSKVKKPCINHSMTFTISKMYKEMKIKIML